MKFVIVKGPRKPSDLLDFLDVRFPHAGEGVPAPNIRVEMHWGLIALDLELMLPRELRNHFRELLARVFEQGARWARDQEIKVCIGCGDRFFPVLDQGECKRDKCRAIASIQGPWR